MGTRVPRARAPDLFVYMYILYFGEVIAENLRSIYVYIIQTVCGLLHSYAYDNPRFRIYIYILYRAIRARLDPPEWMHLSNAKIIANFPRIYGTLYRDFCYTFTHKLYTGDFQAYQKFCM